MKLRVVELLIITTLPAMVLAQKGLPSFGLVAATLIGGTLAAGASNAFNMVIEAETDKLMARTSKRPLPFRRETPQYLLHYLPFSRLQFLRSIQRT
jgi:protoheme IX farnesyltransferase